MMPHLGQLWPAFQCKDSCFQLFYTDPWHLPGRQMCVRTWTLLVEADKEEVWSRASHHLNVRNVLVASVGEMSLTHTPTEAHDILSVLEMTEDRSLWDSRASAGIFTPFAMLT